MNNARVGLTVSRLAKLAVEGSGRTIVPTALLFTLLLAPGTADAFRCGSRIVQDGMHESEVVRLCGEPVSSKFLGYVMRGYEVGSRSLIHRGDRGLRERAWVREEVEVTEMIFNFGPRKLMRKLRFEGGVLVSIRTMGYGYIPGSR